MSTSDVQDLAMPFLEAIALSNQAIVLNDQSPFPYLVHCRPWGQHLSMVTRSLVSWLSHSAGYSTRQRTLPSLCLGSRRKGQNQKPPSCGPSVILLLSKYLEGYIMRFMDWTGWQLHYPKYQFHSRPSSSCRGSIYAWGHTQYSRTLKKLRRPPVPNFRAYSADENVPHSVAIDGEQQSENIWRTNSDRLPALSGGVWKIRTRNLVTTRKISLEVSPSIDCSAFDQKPSLQLRNPAFRGWWILVFCEAEPFDSFS